MRSQRWHPLSRSACLALMVGATLFFALSGLDGATGARKAAAQTVGANEAARSASSGVDVQTVQRLLKQLSEGDPKRYGSVNPGRINGVLNRRTRNAIRNFKRIKGFAGPPRVNRILWSQLVGAQLDLPPMQTGSRRPVPAGKCGLGVSASACQPSQGAAPAAARQAGDSEMAARGASDENTADADTRAAPDKPRRSRGEIPAIRFEGGQGRSYFIQLASLVSEDDAREEWRKIAPANAATLANSGVAIEKAVLKDDRVFYRLLIGPYRDLSQARHLCSQLKQNNQKCLVQRRRGRVVEVDREIGRDVGEIAWSRSSTTVVAADRMPPPPPAQPRGVVTSEPLAPLPLAATPQASESPGGAGMPGGADMNDQRPLPAEDPAVADGVASSVAAGTPSVVAVAPADDGARDPVEGSSAAQRPRSETSKRDLGDHVAVLSKGVVVVPARGSDGAGLESPIVGRRWFDVVVDKLSLTLAGWGVVGLAGAVAVWAMLHRRRYRRRALQKAALADALNEAEKLRGADKSNEVADIVADIRRDFESPQLRDSRGARDAFLQNVLNVYELETVPAETDGSAMLVNTRLKDLLSVDPTKYKLIFLNWIFLNQVGVALDRKELFIEQLDRAIGREVELLRSYFKIHLLELDDRQGLCDRLPGLFYCLQGSDP